MFTKLFTRKNKSEEEEVQRLYNEYERFYRGITGCSPRLLDYAILRAEVQAKIQPKRDQILNRAKVMGITKPERVLIGA